MTPPPIRYPLPTLLAAIALGLLAWRGEAWSRPWREAIAGRWQRMREGPPPPSSAEPRVVAGPIVRRVLLLRADVPYSARPGGPALGKIGFRQFADIYDTWPLSGRPTHYRIGKRHPFGWVAAEDVLPWDTRLVIRPRQPTLPLAEAPGGPTAPVPVSPGPPLPVVGWTDSALRIAVWDHRQPWSEVARLGWVRRDAIAPTAWGALLGQREVQLLLDESGGGESTADPPLLRLRAVLGRLGDPRPLTEDDWDRAKPALPGPVVRQLGESATSGSEELLRIYETWRPDVAWSGFKLRAVPLSALP